MTPIFDRLRRATEIEDYHVFVFEGGSRCFAPDTDVVTDKGLKAISDVKVGDRVKSVSEDGKVEYKTVTGIHVHKADKPMIEIRMKNGKVIRCSEDHKFLFNGEFVSISEILKRIDGYERGVNEIRLEDILSWEYIDDVQTVYDLEVEGNHNYFINAGYDICVHNSSKTYSLIQFFIYYALTHTEPDKPTRVGIFRKKGTWLYSTVWHDFNEILIKMNLLSQCRINKTLKVITLGMTTFEFVGLDDVQKLHGFTSDIIWINEAMEAAKDDFDQLEQRTSRFSILDYNPSAEEHWIYDNVCTRSDCYFDHSTMLDNPFIPENSRRKILSYEPTDENYEQGTADPRKWKIYGLGQRAKIEGLVFPEYKIVKDIPESVDKRWYFADWGYANDPTAIGELGLYQNKIYIKEHCYQTGMLSGDIAKVFKNLKKKRNLKIICESADPRLIKELQNAGIPVFPVHKFPGSIEAGIDYMQSCEIFVTEDSLNFKKEYDNYTYAQDKNGKWLNIPEDDYNHGIDGARYVILNEVLGRNGKPIDVHKVASAIHR